MRDAARSAAPSRGTGDRWHERAARAGADTRFHWDGQRLIGEEDKDGVLQRTYVQQPGLRYGATLAEAPGSDPASAAYRYFGRDAHGSTRAAYAQDKARVGAAEWLPYGQARRALGAAGAHGFTGQWQSARSGDYLFGLRPYSPGLSRWLARDPLGPVDGPNMHAYVRANPIAYVDPEGGSALAVIGGGILAGALAGGVTAYICGRDPIQGALSGAVWGGGIAALTVVAGLGLGAVVGSSSTGARIASVIASGPGALADDAAGSLGRPLSEFAWGANQGIWTSATGSAHRLFTNGGC